MRLPPPNQLILDIRPDTLPGFDNFLPGPNAEALAAVREHAAGLIQEPVLYLWGEAGTGKSHLFQAWCHATGAAPVFPLPEPPQALVVVDDVDRLDAEDQIRLFSLINAAREGAGRVLATGPLPPAQLIELNVRPDLATRLAQGLVFRLHPLSDADKRAALTVRAESHGMRLPDEVLRYLLTHCRRDLPHLLTLVDLLDTHSLSRKRPVSLPMLKEILQQSLAP
ncbi:MAG: DnaA regulatory inactivator Hda [Pseudomonadota bacterium]|nr:DnaA regulatory inactivator Hda [Pseudomonadota bacterium]